MKFLYKISLYTILFCLALSYAIEVNKVIHNKDSKAKAKTKAKKKKDDNSTKSASGSSSGSLSSNSSGSSSSSSESSSSSSVSSSSSSVSSSSSSESSGSSSSTSTGSSSTGSSNSGSSSSGSNSSAANAGSSSSSDSNSNGNANKNLKNNGKSGNSGYAKNNSGYDLKLAPPRVPDKEEEKYWESLFTKKRDEKCSGDRILRFELIKLGVSDDLSELRVNNGRNRFSWIKNWGFDQSAYLFDYLDPVLKPLILEDFKNIYKTFKSYPTGDTKDYKDPYNIKKPIPSNLSDEAKQAIARELMEFNKRINPSIYNLSINAVQINFGVKENRWYEDKSESDFAKSFIKHYDINGDGRLSPREFILATIWSNKKIFGSDDCKLCYSDLIDKIDGIFTYLDCDKDGLISSRDLYRHLPKLRRETGKWNYFSLSNQANIRTAVTNDFILKNMASIKGMLNKNEFRLGILLGFWDRQTDDYRIVEDDSKNLKNLRWEDGDLVDILAMKFIREKIHRQVEQKMQNPINVQIILPQSTQSKDGMNIPIENYEEVKLR